MRPVKLKLKGLNSFIETQEIDFARLTSKGLFGIFGPTGSGKSTILDGITLALYGAVARGSTNYLNTNCEALHVSYEFLISEKETKRYRVDREFRRDKKTGNVRTHSAKILQLTDAHELVLEEQVREVTKRCEEIIGLKLEDFTRTVVLPQGKFSEFLRLEGKDRREMLERLFNLQKYGDELTSRLGSRIKKEQDQANILVGRLNSYQDCSEEILEEKNKELSSLSEKLAQSEKELKRAEENFNAGKVVWDLQKELSQQEAQKAHLEKGEAEIKEYESKVDLGERSLRVKPYLDQYEDTLRKNVTTQGQVAVLEKDLQALALRKEEAQARWEQARLQKDQVLPGLRLKEQNAQEAIEEKKKCNVLTLEKERIKEKLLQAEKDLENTQNRIQKGEAYIAKVNNDIRSIEEKSEGLAIDPEFKKKISESLLILSRSEATQQQVVSLSHEIQAIKEKINEAQAKSLAYSKELEAKEKQLQAGTGEYQTLLEACPGDQETLLALQERLNQVKEQWAKHQDYDALIQKSQAGIQDRLPKLEAAQLQKTQTEQEITELEKELNKLERENLAHALRVALREGEACPVCGAKEHRLEDVEVLDTVNLEQLQALLEEKKAQVQALVQDIIKTQENIKTHENNLKDYQEKITALGDGYKTYDPEALRKEFETLREGISLFTAQKTQWEKEIKELGQAQNQLAMKLNEQKTIGKENLTLLANRENSLKETQAKYEAYEKELNLLQAGLGVLDFKLEYNEITSKEKEKAKLESELKGLRETLKKYLDKKEQLSTELSALKESAKEYTVTLREKENTIQEKLSFIKVKVGLVEDLEGYREELLKGIAQIEENYAQMEKAKTDVEQQYIDCHAGLQSAQTALVSLRERSQKDQESLAKALLEERFKDIEEAKSHLLDKGEIEKLKGKIKNYRDSLTQLLGAIGNLKKKLGENSLTDEQWTQIQKIKEETTTLFKELVESKIKLEANVKTLAEDLLKKKALLKEQAELERQLGLLRELEKLFRGKRFVEFVAAHQLKYVSIEAGKRLQEITSGNYGLEVDENGKFLIRDYKNGGAQRDASTLSGGETFLASLSLALALSAQIQLKGTAPLELFFLDEGFGTLDDNLLEVVMDSLEKLHNDRLSVGIISHVESIKNRVPVKLLVKPAESGMGGSKVRIEVS